MRFDLADGFPLVTTKKLHLKSVIHELLWFLSGDTNIRYLKENGVTIWDEWADKDGQSRAGLWRPVAFMAGDRTARSIDQIKQVVEQIRTNPDSRRLIVSAWNPAEIDKMALAPCHCLFQFYVADGRLSCQLYQRSARHLPRRAVQHRVLCAADDDDGAGDRAEAGRFRPHARRRASLSQPSRPGAAAAVADAAALPRMRINPEVGSIFDFVYSDFAIEAYDPHPHIKAPVAV